MKRIVAIIALLLAVAKAGAATVDTLAIETRHLAIPEEVLVVVPDAAADEACPTVYLLNGFSGDHTSWLALRPDLTDLADQYGMIFVMPNGRDSWYWDSPVDTTMQMESFFVEDLVPYIDGRYNTRSEASKRAISGLSMGGHGALWLAMRHPDIWGNAGSMSGGVDIRPFPESWKMKQRLGAKAENEDVWEAHTVATLVPTLKPGELNITFDCGSDDFFYAVNNQLHQSLLEAGIPHDYTSRPGGHSGPYWKNSILYHLLYFDENFNR